MADLDRRWELYLWSVGPDAAMPRETFDLIATNRHLGMFDIHRVWLTPDRLLGSGQEGSPTKSDGRT